MTRSRKSAPCCSSSAGGPGRGGRQGRASATADRRRTAPTRFEALALLVLTLALIALNRPRVDALIRRGSPPLLASEREFFKIPRLQTMRANLLLSLQVEWQRKYLKRLDQAEPVARRLGIGQDGIRAAFGSLYIPGSTGRLRPALHELYDVAAILDLPARGRISDPAAIRAALARYLRPDVEPRPHWLAPGERMDRAVGRSPAASGSERACLLHPSARRPWRGSRTG